MRLQYCQALLNAQFLDLTSLLSHKPKRDFLVGLATFLLPLESCLQVVLKAFMQILFLFNEIIELL